MNGLYLVCDGGGTKTDFLLFEKTGRVRGRAQGAGANANFVPPAEAAHTVYAGVMECLAQAGAAPAQVREFVLFIPGFPARAAGTGDSFGERERPAAGR